MATYIYGPVQCTGVDSSTGQHEFCGRVVCDITQNASANTSTVNSWRFEIYIRRTAYVSNYTATSNNAVNVWIDGTLVFSSANVGTVAMNNHYESSGSGPLILAQSSTAITLNHNNSGERSLNVKATYTKNLAYMQSITVDETKALPSIVRGTAITSVSDVSLGSAPSVKWTPTASTYGYKIKYECGSWNYTTGAITPNTTSAYTYSGYSIPATVAQQITTSTTGTGTITLITYTETACTNELGRMSKNFTITVPNNSTYTPTASLSLTAVNAFNTSYYLQGRTSWTYSCSGTYKYNATLKSYSLVVTDSSGNQVYTYNGTTASGSVPVINTAGTATFTLTVTDSRGLIGSSSTTRTITAYSKPSITATGTRGTGTVSGTSCSNFVVDEAEGTVIRISYTANYTAVTGNSITIKVTKPSVSTPVTVTAAPAYFAPYSVDNAYDFVVTIYDTVCGSSDMASVTVHIVPAWFPMDFLPNAKGAKFGGVAKDESVLGSAWDIVSDTSVSAGTSAKGILTSSGLEFKNSSNTTTGKFTSISDGVIVGTCYGSSIGSTGHLYVRRDIFSVDIKAVIAVIPISEMNPIYFYVANSSPSNFALTVKRIDGGAISSSASFQIIAIPN